MSDNNTGIYYETWTVYSDPSEYLPLTFHSMREPYFHSGPNATMYFDSYDCASFAIRSYDQLSYYGAQLYPNLHLNYTRVNLYSYEPQLLGTYDRIIQNQTLHQDFLNFYRDFDSSKPTTEDWLAALNSIYDSLYVTRRFYLYYNNVYWYMKLKEQLPLKITFNEVPISPVLRKEQKKLRK